MIIYFQVILVASYSFIIRVRVNYDHDRDHVGRGHGRDHDYNRDDHHVLHFIYSFFHLLI